MTIKVENSLFVCSVLHECNHFLTYTGDETTAIYVDAVYYLAYFELPLAFRPVR